jgi:hypothetical protein
MRPLPLARKEHELKPGEFMGRGDYQCIFPSWMPNLCGRISKPQKKTGGVKPPVLPIRRWVSWGRTRPIRRHDHDRIPAQKLSRTAHIAGTPSTPLFSSFARDFVRNYRIYAPVASRLSI